MRLIAACNNLSIDCMNKLKGISRREKRISRVPSSSLDTTSLGAGTVVGIVSECSNVSGKSGCTVESIESLLSRLALRSGRPLGAGDSVFGIHTGLSNRSGHTGSSGESRGSLSSDSVGSGLSRHTVLSRETGLSNVSGRSSVSSLSICSRLSTRSLFSLVSGLALEIEELHYETRNDFQLLELKKIRKLLYATWESHSLPDFALLTNMRIIQRSKIKVQKAPCLESLHSRKSGRSFKSLF